MFSFLFKPASNPDTLNLYSMKRNEPWTFRRDFDPEDISDTEIEEAYANINKYNDEWHDGLCFYSKPSGDN
jgi:hypothetical protein